MFSRFFIDRPIFAAVLSIFIVIAGLAAMRVLPIAQYPEIAPPVVTVRAVYPGASAEVLEQTVAAPLENADQRRREHDLHELDLDLAGRGRDPGHLRHRHRRRPGGAQRQQPRQAGRAAPAAGSAPPGRDGGEGLLGLPAGARLLLARRHARRPVHLQLRDAERARPALKRVPGTTNVQIFGAKDYAMRIWVQARPHDAAQAHHRRPAARGERAERAVRRRQDRPEPDRRPRRSWSTPSPPRAASPIRRSSRTSSCAPTRTARRCG